MKELLKTQIGQFRIIAFLEGVSLLVLCFIATPLKYIWGNPVLTNIVGYFHGLFFILYVIWTYLVSKKYDWSHLKTTWKVVLASFIPFGTFYIDHHILSKVSK
jgi:integral membrane protein